MYDKDMKHAIDAFTLLLDQFEYTVDSFLRLDISSGAKEEAINVIAASSFLLDKIFAKEDAGKEITLLAKEELSKFDPSKLLDNATSIKLSMASKKLFEDASALKEYLDWLKPVESAPSYLTCDDYGRLALVCIDKLSSIVVDDQNAQARLRICEMMFLNISDSFYQIYLNISPEDFKQKNSYIGFKSINESLDDIRKHIYD